MSRFHLLFETIQMLTIDRRYPLSEVPEAIRYLEEGRAQGKIVITSDLLDITI
jgi:NADPH:quinone reductase-like Zn-dependent oxidoreductase